MYDAIVVGGRCAGSSVSMLLARMGYRVLVVDKVSFPSDTISSHFIWSAGVSCLKRWGVLDRVRHTNCPAINEMGMDVGPYQLVGTPGSTNGTAEMYAPRRTILDKLLLDAAAEAGAEVEESFAVSGLTWAGNGVTGIRGRNRNGRELTADARIVIGADGRHSLVAAAVKAEEYAIRPVLTCSYYSYWRDVPPHRATIRPREGFFLVSVPTNDGLTLALAQFPRNKFEAIKSDVNRHFMAAVERVPEMAGLLHAGTRVERYFGTGDIPNFFRKPYGDGWALVGDAGYHKDPIAAQGISDAFRSAEWLAQAIHLKFSGENSTNDPMQEYQRKRDAQLMPMYELNSDLARLQVPTPEMQALFEALRSNQRETDQFFGTLAGTVPIPEFFAAENIKALITKRH